MQKPELPTSPEKSLIGNRHLWIIFSVTLSATMGISLVTPILPRLIDVFHIPKEEVILLITAFTLPGVVAAPFYGILADRLGRRKTLIPALILFGLAGAGCALVRDFRTLVALRFLQGVGGAALYTLNNTLIGDLFPGQNRIRALGWNTAVISLGMALYPALGGMLATIHWTLPFFVPLFALIPAGLTAFWLKNPEPERQSGADHYFSSALRNLKSWAALWLFLLTFLIFVITFGPVVSFMPLWMNEAYGSNAAEIGLVISLSSLAAAGISVLLGRLSRWLSPGRLLAMAFAVYALALAAIPAATSARWMLLPALLFGLGQGVTLPVAQSLVVSAAPIKYRGAWMAFNSMVILLGISIGPAIGAAAYNSVGLPGLYHLSSAVSATMVFLLLLFGRQLDPVENNKA